MKSFVEFKRGIVRRLILALVCCLLFQSAPVGAQEGQGEQDTVTENPVEEQATEDVPEENGLTEKETAEDVTAESEPIAVEAAISAAFVYHGNLTVSGSPANGAFDFDFRLFNARTAGNQVGSTLTRNDIQVTEGAFQVTLDFGASSFNGQERWLQIRMRSGNSTGAYTTLTPRRPVLAVPYATHASYSEDTRGAYIPSDDSGARRVHLGNGTSGFTFFNGTASGFVPVMRGDANDSRVSMYFLGMANATTDVGRNPLVIIEGRLSGNAAITQRPILDVRNYSKPTALLIDHNGYVGIGTSSPSALLDANGFIRSQQHGGAPSTGFGTELFYHTQLGTGVLQAYDRTRQQYLPLRLNGSYLLLNPNNGGYVGIGLGKDDVPIAPLHINSDLSWATDDTPQRNQWKKSLHIGSRDAIEFAVSPGNTRFGIGSRNNPNGLYFMVTDGSGSNATATYPMVIRSTSVDVKVLRITGGADLAEPFVVAESESVEPGMVVAIDPEQPGELRIADQAYDRTVAGVVSGAGGVQPGIVLQQEGSVAIGEHPVALTGRVYVLADASHGAIQPGDMLTTSDTPGHAMKVTDRERAFGSVLGKAMSSLEDGTGLVLVLVSLQ